MARLAVAVLLLTAVAGAAPWGAEAGDEPGWAYELWHDIMSPYCPGRTLAECPSPQADELRIWILTQAAAGATREEVEASLYTRFGDQILTTPRAEGWGLAAYVVPAVAFVLFGGIVILVLRRLVGGGGASMPSGEALAGGAQASEARATAGVGTAVGLAPGAEADPARARAAAVAESAEPVELTEAPDLAELERRVDEELGA